MTDAQHDAEDPTAGLVDSDMHPEFPLPPEEGAEPEDRKRSADEAVAFGQDDVQEEDDDDYDEGGDAEGGPKKRQRTSRRGRSAPPPKKLNQEQWDAMFEKLQAYKAEHGDCLVPKRYVANPKLGTWVETQRVQYKRLQKSAAESTDASAVTPSKRLNEARLEKLESIGFAWSAKNVRKPKQAAVVAKKKAPATSTDAASRSAARQRLNETQWNEMYERLKMYKEEHGDCIVPKKYDQDPKLATWVETQRVLNNRDYKKVYDSRAPTEPAALTPIAAAEGKSPEEWATELEKETGPIETATEEDVAEVVAATMEVVDQVTAPPETPGTESEVSGTATPGKAIKRLTEERKAKLDELGFVWSLRNKRVDDHWDEMYERLVQYKEAHGDCLVPSRYELDVKLGKWVETQRYEYTKLQRASAGEKAEEKEDDPRIEGAAKTPRPTNPRLTEERLRRLESIGFEWKVKNKMKRYYDRQWDSMYERLLEFKEKHGHTMVPKRHPGDHKLGTWVHTQRIQYRKFLAGSKKGNTSESGDGGNDETKGDEETSFRLTEERRKKLEDAGFVWSARENEKSSERSRITRNSYDDQWDAMFKRLEAYKERHGNVLVPKRCKEDQKLGTWVDTQRVQYKKMKKHLAKMGMEYTGPAPEGEAKAGDAPPNTSLKPVVGRLTDERIRRLEGLGFAWSLRDDWQKHYNELIEYKRLHGHCNVPARYSANRRLGIWVSAQRQQYKILMNTTDEAKKQRSAPLTDERIRLLNDLGFTWTIRSRDSLGESWNQRLAELRAYREEHGNCLVPSRYPPSPELGVWVGTQRTQYRLFMKAKEADPTLVQSSAMSEDRIRQLEELGFVWALRGGSDHVWRTRITELVEYKTAHGNLIIPPDYAENPRLGNWVNSQRIQYQLLQEGKPSQLDPERVAELDSLGFVWETTVAEQMADPEDTVATASALAAAAAASAASDDTHEVEPTAEDVGIDV